MDTKVINLRDRVNTLDSIKSSFEKGIARGRKPVFQTSISAFNEFGECLFEDLHNETVLAGALTVLEKLWKVKSSLKIATINSLMGINDIVDIADSSANDEDHICLWGIGIGGCGDTLNSIRTVNFYERELGQNGHTDQMIPFRVVEEPFASTDPNYSKYFMKRERPDGYYEYYLKAFENVPVIRSLWKDGEEGKDGSEVEEDVHNTTRDDDLEVFVEMHCKLDLKDVHEYFEHLGQPNMTRVNTIGLFTGRKTEMGDGSIDYTNVKLFSKLNMDNEPLKNAKTILWKYRVFVG